MIGGDNSRIMITLGDIQGLWGKLTNKVSDAMDTLIELEHKRQIEQNNLLKIFEKFNIENEHDRKNIISLIKELNELNKKQNKTDLDKLFLNTKINDLKFKTSIKDDKNLKLFIKKIEEVTDSIDNLSEKIEEAKFNDEIFYKKSFINKRKEALHSVWTNSGIEKTGILGFSAFKMALLPIAKYLFFATSNLMKIDNLSRTFGMMPRMTLQQMQQFSRQNALVGNVMSGITNLETQSTLQQLLGNTDVASLKTLDDISRMRYALGMSAEESAEILDIFKGITGESVNVTTNLLKQVAILGAKNGIGYKKLMSDIKTNAEYYAKYAGVGYQNLLKANITANKLGIEFSTITKTLESLNTVESIMEKQMKIALFTNTQFDLVESATYQFMGQTDKAMESLYKNLKLITKEQFDQPYIRGILAQNLGVSVNELVKMYKTAKGFGDEFQRAQQINTKFNEEMGKFYEIFSSVGLDKIKDTFTQYVLEPLNNAFGSNSVGFISSAVELITGGIKLIGKFFVGLDNILANLSNLMGESAGKIALGIGVVASSIGLLHTSTRVANVRIIHLLGQILNAILYGNKWSEYDKNNRWKGGFFAKSTEKLKNGGWKKMLSNKKGLGVAGLALSLTGILSSISEQPWLTGLINGALTGASIGSLTGLPFGTLGGAIIGGIIGLFSGLGASNMAKGGIVPDGYGSYNMATGGIVPNGFGADTFRANLSSNEAVIPLNSEHAQEKIGSFITEALKKDGIIGNELINAIKNINVNLTIVIDNKTDVKSNTIKRAMKLSSQLVEI